MPNLSTKIDDLRNEMATMGNLCDDQVSKILQGCEDVWLNRLADPKTSARAIALEVLFMWASNVAKISGEAYKKLLESNIKELELN